MSDRSTVPIARIPLARAPMRLLAAPAVLLVAGGTAAAGGVAVGGVPGVALVAAGIVVAVLALYLALIPLTVRLDVEVAGLRLRWLGVDRRFALVRGAVTRIPLVGDGAARVRPRFGAVGWALGPARLRGSETIQLVRLARSPSVILVPTDLGRLAIAARSEQQLLAALEAAARVQQRLDEVVFRTRALQPELQVAEAPAIVEPEAEAVPEERPGRMLTGIERTLLEERLSAERAAALAAAEAERRAVAAAAQDLASSPSQDALAPPAAAGRQRSLRRREPIRWRRPAWLSAPRLPRPAIAVSLGAVLGYAIAALPLAVAGGVWIVASVAGRLDLPDPQLRSAALALLLAGPAGAIGGLLARAWFPRLVGLVAMTSMLALILVGRALLG